MDNNKERPVFTVCPRCINMQERVFADGAYSYYKCKICGYEFVFVSENPDNKTHK
jgi:tRNA(Ile2) C34 agmatinyltransferase TiaS